METSGVHSAPLENDKAASNEHPKKNKRIISNRVKLSCKITISYYFDITITITCQ